MTAFGAPVAADDILKRSVTRGDYQTSPQSAVKDAYRALAKAAHPDQGGDVTVWNALSEAYEQAMAQFR